MAPALDEIVAVAATVDEATDAMVNCGGAAVTATAAPGGIARRSPNEVLAADDPGTGEKALAATGDPGTDRLPTPTRSRRLGG